MTPTSSTSGEASASRSAIASSWPGSQSRMIGVGVIARVSRRPRLRSAATAARRAARPRARRPRTRGGAPRLAVAALEQRDDEAGGERVARGGAVHRLDRRRRRAGDLAAVLESTAPSAPSVTATSLPARDDLVLEAVDDQQVRLDVDRPRRRGVEREERRPRAAASDDRRRAPRAGRARRPRPRRGVDGRVRARHDDDLVLAVVVDEDQRDARSSPACSSVELDAGRARARERLVGEARRRPTAPTIRTRRRAARRRPPGSRPCRPGSACEARAGDRLARPRQPLDARDEVEVDRADDGELDRHGALRRRARAGRRARGRAGSRAGRTGPAQSEPRSTSTASAPRRRAPRARARARPARGTPARRGAARRVTPARCSTGSQSTSSAAPGSPNHERPSAAPASSSSR